MFRLEVTPPSEGETIPFPPRPKPGKPYSANSPVIASKTYTQTPISLFRFSALTFNGASDLPFWQLYFLY